MPKTYKIVFAGPVGAGKTTAIQSLSDIEVVTTEAATSDDARFLKATTTVAMDYGLMKLASGDQVRFSKGNRCAPMHLTPLPICDCIPASSVR